MGMAEVRKNAPYIAMFATLVIAFVGVVVIVVLIAFGAA
jgi:hypothetical protein